MRKLLFFFVIILCTLSFVQARAQTPTFASLTSGLSGSNPAAGSSGLAYMGFSISVSGGSITFNSFNFTASSQNITNFLANGTLYRSPTSTFNPASPGTPVGNVTFSGTTVTINNFNETVGSATTYYFLVADAINTTSSYEQLVVSYGTNWATDINGTSYPPHFSGNYGYSFSSGTPYPLTISNQTTGLTSSAATIAPGTSSLKVFSFSITNNSSSTYTFSAFNINSNTSSLGSTMNNFKLYSNLSDTFPATAAIATAATATGSYVNFSLSSETIAAHTTKYYFLVCDAYSGGAAAAIQFNIQDGQSTKSIVASSPNASYNTATAFGNTYNINYANLTVTSLTGGTTSGTLSAFQTDVVLFGFSLTASSTISVSNFNINSTNSAASYFGNGVLYRCNNTNYASATSKVAVGTVTFSGNYANVVFSTPESITTSGTNQNYFLVADNNNVAANTTTTIAFNFTSGQSQAAITQTSPTSSYNTFAISGNTLTLPGPTLLLTGENGSSNGITQGSLAYGQNGIVLFGVGIEAVGSAFTLTNIKFHTSGSETSYFSNFQLYRSTSPTFPGGTPAYSGGAGCNCGHIDFTSISEAIPAGTTYYYFLTADFTVGTGTVPSTFQISFVNGQNPAAITTSSATYNTYNVSGTTFNIAGAENWTGAANTDFLNAANYKATNGGSGFVPTSTTVINIGGSGQTYTNQPKLQSGTTTTIGGLIFGTTGTPTLTINSGLTLVVNTSMQVNNTTTTITGPGTLSLGSSSVTNSASSTTLNLSGGVTVNNGGTFNTGTSSNITLAGSSKLSNSGTFTLASTAAISSIANSTLANTGTFTLVSDANSSARIGQVTGTGSITGSYAVQRFITGGAGMRGYRLMSSPVYNGTANSNNVYSINYLAQSSYITGSIVSANGIDKAGNPTLYLFRENVASAPSSYFTGNFRGVAYMGTTTTNTSYTMDVDGSGYSIPAGNGFLFFFRGDRAAAVIDTETVTTYVPVSSIATATGTLNYGSVTYKNWYTPTSSNLLYSTTTGNDAIRGYNLLGNPYPSPISWTALYNNNSANLGNTIYEFNPATNHYGSYQAGGTGTQNATDIIGSGQGFFAVASNASAAVTFTEAVKSTSQPSTLLMGIAKNTAATPQYIHIKMIKDAVNYDDAVIGFTTNSDTKYSPNEDAIYLKGNSPPETFSTLSSDSVNLSINNMPLPDQNGRIVKLYVSAVNSGTYTLKRSELVGIPSLYQIWLKDNLQKDSLDFRANDSYSFIIDKNNAASYGTDRFQLIFRQSPDLSVHLLNFAGTQITGAIQSQLTWKVENESNYTTFYVQRSTDGGKTFSSIGSLQSDSAGTYNFIDKAPMLGSDYYRLQLSDINNNITYSQVIGLQFSNLSNNALAGTMSVYPNPAHDKINVSINAAGGANAYSVMITSSTGAVVKQVGSVAPTSTYDISAFMPGTYYIIMTDNSTKTVIAKNKFVKL